MLELLNQTIREVCHIPDGNPLLFVTDSSDFMYSAILQYYTHSDNEGGDTRFIIKGLKNLNGFKVLRIEPIESTFNYAPMGYIIHTESGIAEITLVGTSPTAQYEIELVDKNSLLYEYFEFEYANNNS